MVQRLAARAPGEHRDRRAPGRLRNLRAARTAQIDRRARFGPARPQRRAVVAADVRCVPQSRRRRGCRAARSARAQRLRYRSQGHARVEGHRLVTALRIVSVCRSLPTPADPSAGIFVLNRLAAISQAADIRVVQPVPYLPLGQPLPPWARAPSHRLGELEVEHAPMLYVPGVLKSLDGDWLARSIAPLIERMHASRPIDLIDAHFG